MQAILLSFLLWAAHSTGLAKPADAGVIPIPAVAIEAMSKDAEIAMLMKSATTLWRNQEWNEAARQWQVIYSLAEGRYGKGQILTELSAAYLGDSLRGRYEFRSALPLLQRAVVSSERLLGSESPYTALVLDGLAATHRALGQPKLALPFAQRALKIKFRNFGETHPEVAKSIGYLCLTYLDLGMPDAALDLAEHEVSMLKVLGMEEHLEFAKALFHLGRAYSWKDRLPDARNAYYRSLSIYEKTIGIDHPEAALSLINLAQTYQSLALYDEALPLLKRALSILERVNGSTGPDTSNGLIALASIYVAVGQPEIALPLQQRALEIDEKLLGFDHPRIAVDLNQIAIALTLLDRVDEALVLRKRALSINEKAYGSTHPTTASSLNDLAETYVALAQFDQALALQQRALAINETELGVENSETARSLIELADTYAALGQHVTALAMGQRALVINETIFGAQHPRTLITLTYVARIVQGMGDDNMAISLLKAAVNGLQGQRAIVARIGNNEYQSYTSLVSPFYQVLVQLLSNQGRLSEAQFVLDMLKEDEQFDFVRRSEVTDPRHTRITYNATENIWMERYRLVSSRLAALGAEEQELQKQSKFGLSAVQKQRKQVLVDDLRVAQIAFNVFLNEMRASFARSGPARTTDIAELNVETVSELQTLIRGLGHDAVLLQYYVTHDQVGMLLTTPGVQLARSINVNAKELNRQIAEFRRMLRDSKSNLLPASQALYQLLVAPVAMDLEQAGAKTVMLSLDGALRYLPFGALHDGQRYLVQRWNLPIYTSVTKNRLRDAVTPQWQAAGLGVTRATGGFEPLPAVKDEMNSIVRTGKSGVLPGEVYLDGAFTAMRLQDVSQRSFQLLHVASHFRFSPGTEVNSFLLLGDGQQLTLGDIRTQNYRFDNVDLLTLSACDTGLGGGRDAQGREIEGFGVIAQQQGAKAVLATLWPVADQSTATLMAEMYRRREEQKLTKTEALRQAQLSLLSQSRYAHPFYWAPFILMGNWL